MIQLEMMRCIGHNLACFQGSHHTILRPLVLLSLCLHVLLVPMASAHSLHAPAQMAADQVMSGHAGMAHHQGSDVDEANADGASAQMGIDCLVKCVTAVFPSLPLLPHAAITARPAPAEPVAGLGWHPVQPLPPPRHL